MLVDRLEDELRAALAAADDASLSAADRAEMLMQIAMGLQKRPRTADYLMAAVALYERALLLCGDSDPLLRARLIARKATALQAMPDESGEMLQQARAGFDAALPVLAEAGRPEEHAEAQMNLGIVLQALAGAGAARIGDAIAAYQRALAVFSARRYPVEFALLQSNLATAYLAMPGSDGSGRIREALAVQAFEDALKVLSPARHPVEYAMVQNNLGNALQYASSAHALENNLRALAAYDEALKVRTRDAAPVEYANTIANKANCLRNLPDDPSRPEQGNAADLRLACELCREARTVFAAHKEHERARLMGEAVGEIEREILALAQ